MSATEVVLIDSERLYRYVSEICVGLGLPASDADVVSRSLIEADLRGVRSHGVMRMPTYQKGIAAGTINPRPSIKILTDGGATLVIDGDGAMGQVAAEFAMRLTVERTLEHGIAAVGLRNSRHCGAMAHWALMALPHNCIGFAATNAGMNMAPTGGLDKLVGNNPFAVAVPTNRDWPMVMDMATSVAAGGKLDIAAVRGEKIPLGWAIDEAGQPTDDPIVARRGTLLPVGGPKGYAMAVMLDVVCGVLTGGRYAAMLGMGGFGQYFQAMAVDRFIPVAEFKARMDALIDQIHESRLAPGAERIYVPGEIEHNLATERRAKGMPLEVRLVEALAAIAREVGVQPLAV